MTGDHHRLKTHKIVKDVRVPLTSQQFGILYTRGDTLSDMRKYNIEVFNVDEKGNIYLKSVPGEGETEYFEVTLFTEKCRNDPGMVLKGIMNTYDEHRQTAKGDTRDRIGMFISALGDMVFKGNKLFIMPHTATLPLLIF